MSGQWTPVQARAVRQPSEPLCDTFTSWAFATGFRDSIAPGAQAAKPKALWLMLRLSTLGNDSPPALLSAAAAQLQPGWLYIPQQYASPLRGLEKARHCTALASPAFIRYLVDPGLEAPDGHDKPILASIRSIIDAYEIGLQASEWTECTNAKPLISKAEKRPKAVIGVIDDGLPFAHHRFSWNDQGQRRTRFLALWEQSEFAKSDRRWCLGRTLDGAQMDKAIRDGSISGRVDDDAVYHHAGTANLLRHRVTHGAHVLDLACGAEPPTRANDLPAIIGVQLRPMESTLGLSPGAHLFDAIRFVVAQADAACGDAAPCPIAINASVGNIAGPHDGHSLIEEAMDELLRLRRKAFPGVPIDVVLPAGNSHLSRCHAWSEMAPDSSMKLDWHLSVDDGTSNYLEIWLRPKDFNPDDDLPDLAISISLTPPPPAPPMPQPLTVKQAYGQTADAAEIALIDGDDVIAVVGLHPQPANGRYWMALVTIAPTAAYGPWQYAAPAGNWQLEITVGEPSASIYCNVYSQRDDKSFGHKGRGRQAMIGDNFDRVFDNSGATMLRDGDSFRRRVGTVNGLATGTEVRVAGGLISKPGGAWEPARYSSVAIPERAPDPFPDPRTSNRVFAFTEDSPVLHGLHAAGTRSGTIASVSGTSMAAPQLARVLSSGTFDLIPAVVKDFDDVFRPVVRPARDLQQRSKRRRGEA